MEPTHTEPSPNSDQKKTTISVCNLCHSTNLNESQHVEVWGQGRLDAPGSQDFLGSASEHLLWLEPIFRVAAEKTTAEIRDGR